MPQLPQIVRGFGVTFLSMFKKVTTEQPKTSDKRSNPGFLQGFEERWDRRQDNQ